MALNMITDKQFDQALEWLAKKEQQTKSDLIRNLVLEKAKKKQNGFKFGALEALLKKSKVKGNVISKELKEMDLDHDLD